jgi:hypothetical protein
MCYDDSNLVSESLYQTIIEKNPKLNKRPEVDINPEQKLESPKD